MNKIKDLIYNSSDILVAIIILAIAAGVIGWRLDVILNYPKEVLGTEHQSDVITGQDVKDTINDVNNPKEDEEITEGYQGEAQQEEEPKELWVDNQLTKSVKVDVEGNSATEAVQCLIDKELFKDYAEYKEVCTSLGINDEQVKAGEFTFKKGSTKEEIAKAINWG